MDLIFLTLSLSCLVMIADLVLDGVLIDNDSRFVRRATLLVYTPAALACLLISLLFDFLADTGSTVDEWSSFWQSWSDHWNG